MPHVVFIAPHFLENTNRYLSAFAALHGVNLSVVSEDPESALPAALRGRIALHYKVDHALDAGELTKAVGWIHARARVDRLTGGLEQLQMPMAAVRDALDLEGLRTDTARAFRDKDRMKEVLRAAGVPVATSTLARSPSELRAFIERVGYPVIVKPQAGLGARATYRVTSAADLAALAPPSPAEPLQIEEFVRAREHTCETVTIGGRAVWRSGTRYFPSPLEAIETPWMQYCVLLPREDEDTEWTRFANINGAALTALFGRAGGSAAGTALTHMEWFLKDDGTALVNEVGVRPPGVAIMPLMGLAHDVNFFAKWAELIAFDRFDPPARRYAAGAAFFRGHGGGTRIASVEGIEEAVVATADALVELRTPKVGQPRAESYEGEGWATVRAPTTEGVKRALLALIERVKIRYA